MSKACQDKKRCAPPRLASPRLASLRPAMSRTALHCVAVRCWHCATLRRTVSHRTALRRIAPSQAQLLMLEAIITDAAGHKSTTNIKGLTPNLYDGV